MIEKNIHLLNGVHRESLNGISFTNKREGNISAH